ncbi:hypothetical protein V2G26_006454 [Clonostachys chloroleuca]
MMSRKDKSLFKKLSLPKFNNSPEPALYNMDYCAGANRSGDEECHVHFISYGKPFLQRWTPSVCVDLTKYGYD